jgi:hypothetical protein
VNELLNIRQRNKVRIKTKLSKKDVLFRENYPRDRAEQQIYKYCCPICLMYFNTILVSSCCENYICRFCIGDLAKKAKKDFNFTIRCSHCMEEDFRLQDVDLTAAVKFYTDTPNKLAMEQKSESNDKIVSECIQSARSSKSVASSVKVTKFVLPVDNVDHNN